MLVPRPDAALPGTCGCCQQTSGQIRVFSVSAMSNLHNVRMPGRPAGQALEGLPEGLGSLESQCSMGTCGPYPARCLCWARLSVRACLAVPMLPVCFRFVHGCPCNNVCYLVQ